MQSGQSESYNILMRHDMVEAAEDVVVIGDPPEEADTTATRAFPLVPLTIPLIPLIPLFDTRASAASGGRRTARVVCGRVSPGGGRLDASERTGRRPIEGTPLGANRAHRAPKLVSEDMSSFSGQLRSHLT